MALAQGMAESAFTQKIFPAGDGELPETRCLPLELSGSPVLFRHMEMIRLPAWQQEMSRGRGLGAGIWSHKEEL